MTPDVRVVRGAPDDDELAALVAGLAAGSAGHDPAHTATHDGSATTLAAARRRWMDAAQHLADPLRPGPDAWRWSALP
ncbi:MAG TPA: acyl-CoA carboxylase epsilon subunit, partial [Actinotalea sp.]|nr:acyl-CoA carboxylase epsilon subunit [Actinotalea sp.]